MTENKEKCPLCDGPESEEMVQCDSCDQWVHFTCAGVDQNIINQDWQCHVCRAQIQKELFKTPSKRQDKGSMEDDAANKQDKLLTRLGRITSESSPSEENKKLELARLEEERKATMTFIQKKYAILSMHDSSEHVDDDNQASSSNAQRGMHRAHENNLQAMLDCNKDIPNRQRETQRDLVTNGRNCATQSNTMQVDSVLNINNIHARQVISPDLPTFSGKPEEWPLFISNFENSTRICGFSNEENMLRLQRAIKGRALEYVGNQLLLPAMVPQVIATLKMIFGRPENIINSLLTKLRASPSVNANKLDTLINFSLEVKNIAATMQVSGLEAHLNNPMLIQELIEKLPAPMRLNWAMHARQINKVTVETLSDWLYDSAEAASSIITLAVSNQAVTETEKRKTQRVNMQEERSGQKGSKCFTCDETHEVATCPVFEKASYDEKWGFVHEFNLCRSCLKQHNPQYCRERKACGINNCTAKHHPKLHNLSSKAAVVASQHVRSSNVLYKIVPVTIHGGNNSVDTFAFLDDGSGPTLIEQGLVDELGIDGPKSCLSLKWTDGTTREEENSKVVNLDVAPKNINSKIKLRNVRTVQGLDLPCQTLCATELQSRYKHLRGLPIDSYYNVQPKLIIGLNNIRAAMPLKFREGKPYEPAAVKTRLGWIVFGTSGQTRQAAAEHSGCMLYVHVHEWKDDISLHNLVAEKMKFEEQGFECDARENFLPNRFPKLQKVIHRSGNRFITKLLWKQEQLSLPDNFFMALRRLNNFESKLSKDEFLKKQVNEKIVEMVNKGYARMLSPDETSANHARKWYLPMFVVSNPNKPNKIRLVWDAAAEYQETSLNKCLDKGPDLLTPLVDVLFNFRVGKIGISGDICEMYHRVGVDSEDQHAQRFLWRNCDTKRPPDVYILTVMSFGASCSPSIAQFVKNKNAYENKKAYPRAAKSILERHYVDDMLDSVDSVEEAINLARDVSEIHRLANFHIRGWLSNSKQVLASLGNDGSEENFCQAGNKIEQHFDADKVLGLWWNTTEDKFTFSLKYTKASADVLQGLRRPTKRELLRLAMSIFDPLGFISHFTIHARILLQKIWRSNIDWDDMINDDLAYEWDRWLQVLPTVKQVKVPRCYFRNSTKVNGKVELHIFTDASEYAYAAVAYFRIKYKEEVEVSLVCSKSRVAPLRPLSIPRMELMAAVLGARLSKIIAQAHDICIDSIRFWTDSRTVLQWIRSDPRSYKQFVMFRVGEIQELTDINTWNFVPSKHNVADLATKWKCVPDFGPNQWFAGPRWLQAQDIIEEDTRDEDDVSCQEEIVQHLMTHASDTDTVVSYQRFSNWTRLHRCMAYVRKFVKLLLAARGKRQNSRKAPMPTSNANLSCVENLTTDELDWSQNFLYRIAQTSEFHKEISQLQQDPTTVLPTKSILRKFSPYLDEYGVIRQRTRVQKTALVGVFLADPIVLPKRHYITRLLVENYHKRFKHVNHEAAINAIFEKFRIPGLRGLLKSVRSSCGVCRIAEAKPKQPEMGMLPEARTSAFTRPFTYVGLDFFGPLLVTVGRRSEKRYGVIFTCLTSRAVHLEVAFSLSTSSCIFVIRNFIGRRGRPRQMFSDNGTNLKAADKTLREADVDFRQLQNEFTAPDMTWTFIPPASPNMGGAWERLIRSIKNTMYKIISPTTKLTDEVLHNLLVEVESILNCRPLTYLSLDTAEQEVLTPNHILLGSACGDKPPGVFSDRDQFVKQSWRYSQLLADQFWKRWVAEILPDMTGRTKWFNRVRPIALGDVCIVVDQNLPRHQWPKGIVTQVFPGKDGQVRSAIVHTINGDYHRPASKIAILDVHTPRSTGEEDEVFPTDSQDTGGEDVTSSALLRWQP